MYKLVNDYGKDNIKFSGNPQISCLLSQFYVDEEFREMHKFESNCELINKNVLRHTHCSYTIENLEAHDKNENNMSRYHIFDYHVLTQLSFLIDDINNFISITFESKTLEIKTTITLDEILIRDKYYEKIIFKQNDKYFIKLPFWFSRNINYYFILYLSHHEILVDIKENTMFELYANVARLDTTELNRIEKKYERDDNLVISNMPIIETAQSFCFDLNKSDVTCLNDLSIAVKELIWYYKVDNTIVQLCDNVTFYYISKNQFGQREYGGNGWYSESVIMGNFIKVDKTYKSSQLCIANQFLRDENSYQNELYYVLPFCVSPKNFQPSGEFINYGDLSLTHHINHELIRDGAIIKCHIVAFGYKI